MSCPTHVCIVASPRPRTGKTILARALTEFYRMDGGSALAFDLDAMDSTLLQFLPTSTVRADIDDTEAQIALFDQLIVPDETPKVVDVSAHAFEAFFKVMAEIDFAGEARRQSIEPVILFATSPDPVSAKTYVRIAQRFPDVPLAPVYNEGIAPGSHLRDRFPPMSVSALSLRIPALSPTLRSIIDTKPFSFEDFQRRPPPEIPDILEAELNSWLKRLHLQFRELGLRLLLSKLRGSLRDHLQNLPRDRSRPA